MATHQKTSENLKSKSVQSVSNMTAKERMAERQAGDAPANVSKPSQKKPIPKWTGGFDNEKRSIESRASELSTVERRIVKQPNICKLCLENNDPRKVPVHPNCDCNVVTDSITSGAVDKQSRFLQTLSRANMDIETIVGDEFHGDLILDPETVAIMDAEDVRFSDIAKWLEIVQPYLDKLDRAYDYVSIAVDDDTQDAVQQVQETVDQLAEGSEDFAEAIKTKKLWFALAKAVAL
jgi:hypothetical protein